jgi:cyclic lactone autoinducer peptide
MAKTAVKYISSFLSMFAVMAVGTACFAIWHMPKVPQELLKK